MTRIRLFTDTEQFQQMKTMHTSAIRLIGAAVAFLLAFAAFGADETIPVPKPLVKVGDRWSYRAVDYWTNRPGDTSDSRVVFVGPDEISMTNNVKGSERATDSQFRSDWAIMATSFGTVFDPPLRLLKFPLQAGATYEADWQVIAVKDSPARSKNEATVKVMGWEDVVVPAGKFRALKVEAKGTYQQLYFPCGGGWLLWKVWYVPEVKRWVKISYEDSKCGSNSPNARNGFELMEFNVQ